MRMVQKLSAATAVAGALLAFAAQPAAAIPFATGSFQMLGFTSTDTDLLTTDVIDFPAGIFGGGSTGDFADGSAPAIPAPLLPAGSYDFTAASGFDFSDAVFGTFDAMGILNFNNSCVGTGCTRSFYISGDYTVGTGWGNSGETFTASMTISLTQTNGAGNAISFSGTFNSPASPPPPGVPEPASIALLGAGLLGIGASRRRKQKKA